MRGQQCLLGPRASLKVLSEFLRMLQVISNNLIDVRQFQTIVLLYDFLGRGAPVERSNHKISVTRVPPTRYAPWASLANGISSTRAVTSRLSPSARHRSKTRRSHRGMLGFVYAGAVSGTPFLANSNARNFACFVSLALRETPWSCPGVSRNIWPGL
jgi:hypothetical protein